MLMNFTTMLWPYYASNDNNGFVACEKYIMKKYIFETVELNEH